MTIFLADPDLRVRAQELRPDRAHEEVLAAVSWSVLTEPGDAVAGAVRHALGTAESLVAAVSGKAVEGIDAGAWSQARRRWRPRADVELVRQALAAASRTKARLLLPDDEDWPGGLAELGPHAPVVLWVRGSLPLPAHPRRAVSLVGARASTPYGEEIARELAGDLALRGYAIVSGGAYGIDGVAHRAALGVGGGTIALLAGGVDRLYPAGHSSLLSSIADRGALVSEVPCGTTPTKWRFLARNRLIAAFSGATVVVEAGWRSGSLNTAGHAAELGRMLGAVPGPVTSAASAGCHRLLREYDASCVTSADEVAELLGDPAEPPMSAPVDPARTRLLDAMSVRSPRTPWEIARRSGLAVEQVEALLGLIALEGTIERGESGWRIAGTADRGEASRGNGAGVPS